VFFFPLLLLMTSPSKHEHSCERLPFLKTLSLTKMTLAIPKKKSTTTLG